MKATISLDSLWQIIQSLSINNQKWLASKLQENIYNENRNKISKEELLSGIEIGLKELKLKQEGKIKSIPARELLKELQNENNN